MPSYKSLISIIQDDFKRNPIRLTDGYNLSHFELKKDLSWEVAHIYNRANPMILYGANQILLNILTRPITMKMVLDAESDAKRKPYNMHFPLEMWCEIVEKFNPRKPWRIEITPDGISAIILGIK